MKRDSWRIEAGIGISLAGYVLTGYILHRENFVGVASVYLCLFAAYLFLMRRATKSNFSSFLVIAIVFRFAFLFSFPRLSDDYFRFVWDGIMTNLFHNPYTVLPSTFIRHSGDVNELLEQLYSRMNSPDYYTIYPPVLQFIFAFAAWLSPHSLLGAVMVLRLSCIAAEIGTLVLLKKLLHHFQLPVTNLLWYALNPLVIIELSGNLHFEAVMIFFLVLAIYLLVIAGSEATKQSPTIHEPRLDGMTSSEMKKAGMAIIPRFIFSAIAFSLSIATKLIPLLFLPFLIRRLGWKRSIIYFAVIAAMLALLFLPFIDRELISNFGSSMDLYFQKFEFNASIYYIIRWIGFAVKGYNIIQSAGQWLAASVFISVMVLMVTEKKIIIRNFFSMAQWALTIFLLLSTTVHPWYLTTLVMFTVFTEMKFAIVWSLVVILSYATYQTQLYEENLWLTAAEYAAVLLTILIEFRSRRPDLLS